jgi:hypothetical protein
MKKDSRLGRDDLRPEYDFDYSKAKPNPYAARLKGHAVAVLLAPDVATAFPTTESVNSILRAVINAVPRRSAAVRRGQQGRDNNEMQLTRRAKARRRPPRS